MRLDSIPGINLNITIQKVSVNMYKSCLQYINDKNKARYNTHIGFQ